MRSRHLFWLALSLGLVMVVRTAEPDPELINAEKTLQEAKVETTGPALLQFFRERTLTEADRARLGDAVRRLGDDDFDTREKAEQELLRAGRKALPFLRPALRDKDPERARRAAQCVQEIESNADLYRIGAAARVLMDRKPDGAAAVLLAYLPGAEDETVEDALFRALLTLGMKDGKADAVLVKALTDKEPLRRAAAAHVLGRLAPGDSPGANYRAAVRRLLTDDEARVRFEAAVSLARAGDKEAVPALIALLAKGPMPLGWKAQEILYRIAGDKAPMLALTDAEEAKRVKVADAWTDWWRDSAATTDLAKINLDEAMQGVNVICQEGSGTTPPRVWACRADGKPLWEIKNVMAWDAQLLPNGRVLIAEYGVSQVSERDLTGKIVWSVMLTNTLSTCQRLRNGNTFITTFGEILEVDPKGVTLWSQKNPNGGLIGRSHRLRNGNILYAAGGFKVIEVDAKFNPIRTAEVPSSGDSWMSLEPLPGDRFLISPYGSNKVMEIDVKGKVLWECATQTPMSAVRLANGNTLVGSDRGHAVIEYNREGKEVWKLKLDSSVRCVRRY